jgi:hypothetical protein
MRHHAGRIGGCAALVAARKLPPPAGDTSLARLHRDWAFALPGFAFTDRLIADFGRTVHHKNKARQRRQPEHDVFGTGQDIFIKPKHGMHSQLLTVTPR